jgi:competence protein ComGC
MDEHTIILAIVSIILLIEIYNLIKNRNEGLTVNARPGTCTIL